MKLYEGIMKPLEIGNMKLRNRTIMCAMGVHTSRLIESDCTYTKAGADYLVERAKGGTALIVTGALQVQNRFENVGHCITQMPTDFIENSQYLVSKVHENGAKLVAQLTAGTGRANFHWSENKDNIAPSDDLPNVWRPLGKHRGLTLEEIEFYIQSFADSAKLVMEAGYDGVELHAVHEGYLMDQFTLECCNHRTDAYGGSLENRLRFPCEIIKRIKSVCGKDFPVMVRYSVRSMMKGFNQGAVPGEDFKEVGRDLNESRQVARLLEAAGADALDCDNGTYDSWWWAHPSVYMPKACNLEDVIEIKKEVNIPVICAGRFDDPDLVNEIILQGKVDAVGLARPLLADPEWANKVEQGKTDDIRPCIACHAGCLARIFQGQDLCCAVNPAVGHEQEYTLKKADREKRILIVGGGIGGMEAARVCALRGHEVHLFEKTDRLGGVFIAAAAPEFKEDDKRLIVWYEKQMKDLKVHLHMNTTVTKEDIKDFNADEIFICTGARPRNLLIDGLEKNHTLNAADALLNPDEIQGKVAVIGGGLTGCEIAYDLAQKGKNVTIIEALDDILTVKGLSAANRKLLVALLEYHNVPIMKNSKILKADKNGLDVECNREIKYIPADTIIVSVGYVSDHKLYDEIAPLGIPCHNVGDSNIVSNLMGAIWEANEIARKS